MHAALAGDDRGPHLASPRTQRCDRSVMSSVALTPSRRVLADVVPGGAVRDVVLVAGSAAFVGLAAQIAVPLPFTPVPLSGQTFAVLLSVAALGPARGALGMLLYAVAGIAGLPWFAGHQSGWAVPSLGYVLGFVLAAVVVGALARRGAARTGPSRGRPGSWSSATCASTRSACRG